MDMLFVYEDKIAEDSEGNYYTGSAFSQSVFDRYLKYFDNIILLMRRANVAPDDRAALAKMNRLDSDRISVVLLPDLWDSMGNFLNIKKRREFLTTVTSNITPGRAVVMRAPSSAAAIAARYCRKRGIPFLAEAVGCPWDSLWNHSLKGKVLAPLSWFKMRRTMKAAPYAVYVTSEFLQRRYPSRGLSAAISDVELQSADEALLAARLAKISAHKGVTKLATAAAVNVAFKGQRYVIEALAELKAAGRTDFEYHMAGGGDSSALKALAESLGVAEQVVFEGSLPHDKMFRWLDDMDLYIQPSLQEGLPRAVVEAMSRGLPALGARTGGIPELLGESCIFPRGDSKAIADMLAELSPERMAGMAENNFEHAKAFRRELLAGKRDEFYSAFAREAEGVRA